MQDFSDLANTFYDEEAIKTKNMADVVVNKIKGVNVFVSSIQRLIHNIGVDAYVNDTIIDLTLTQMAEKSAKLVYVLLSTAWFTLQNRNPRALKKLAKDLKNIKNHTILAPVCMAEHWILLELSLSKKTAVIYDSLWNRPEPHNYHKLAKRRCTTLIQFCKDNNISDGKFQITYHHNLPTQKGGIDCGIYVLLYAEHILQGMPLDNIKHSNIMHHRRRFARNLLIKPVTITTPDYRTPPSPATSHED